MAACMASKRKNTTPVAADIKFRGLVAAWAKRIHAEPTRLRFQKMTRKWASCSTSGQITFSTSLLTKPRRFQEAVIVHELVHLLVPNHGKLFKSMFTSFMPNGEQVLSKLI